jgi:hypothetical protein
MLSVREIEKMPSPDTLKVGDRVRFIALPDEWNEPSYGIHPDSISFMKRMLKRATPVRVTMIDEFGTPWLRQLPSNAENGIPTAGRLRRKQVGVKLCHGKGAERRLTD